MKNRIKTALFVVLQIIIITSILLLSCYIINHVTTKGQEQETTVVEEQPEPPEPLEIVIPEPNNMGTVTIITQNPNTGEEVTTEIYGQIKILNNGKNGEQQQYILYTE